MHRLRDSRVPSITIPLCSVRREKSPNAGNYNVARCLVVKAKTRCPFAGFVVFFLFFLFFYTGALIWLFDEG